MKTKARETPKPRKHVEPSAASLREIPEVDPARVLATGRGPDGLRAVLAYARARRGRPPKGEQAPNSTVRSLRFPATTWKLLERHAKKQGVSLHELLRTIITDWLAKAG